MKKATILLVLPFILFVSIIVAYTNSALAYRWPDSKWGPPMSVKLEYNDAHKYTATTFGVYFNDNTTIKPDGTPAAGDFTVTIDYPEKNGCELNGGEYTFQNTINKDEKKRQCGGSKNFKVAYSSGEYQTDIKMTVYKIRLSIPQKKGNYLQFNVQADAAYAIGFLAWDSIWAVFTQTPVVIDGSDKRRWGNAVLPIHEGCNKVTTNGPLTFYDTDNKNSLLFAQDNGGRIGNPEGWSEGGDYPDLQYEFRDLNIGLERKFDNKLKFATAILPEPRSRIWNWERTSGNYYIPKNTASGQVGALYYDFANNNKVFNIRFNDLNNDNYIAFSSPLDEFVKKCENPPNNWELTSKSKVDDVDKKTIFTGSTVEFKHWVWDTGKDPVVDTTISVGLSGVGGALGDSYENQIVGEAAAWYKSRSVTISNVGDEQCDTVKYSPQKMVNDVVSGDGSSKACVHAIDPESVVSTKSQYEKGSNSIEGITSKIDVADGGGCPTQAINIPYKWSIKYKSTGTLIDKSGDLSFDYGNGNCNNKPENIITLNDDLKSLLNNKSPGPSDIQYCVNVNNEGDKCGDIEVYEVPFARFYGNDVYATGTTNGEIRFNDPYNDPDTTTYDGRGSVSQYAALAFGNVKIDTAAYRHRAFYASMDSSVPVNVTIAPNGLDSASSKFGTRSAAYEYKKVLANVPENCTTFTGVSINLPTGCYVATDATINATDYSNRVTLKADTVVIKGDNVNIPPIASPPPAPPTPTPPAPTPTPGPVGTIVKISANDGRGYYVQDQPYTVGSYYSIKSLLKHGGQCSLSVVTTCINKIKFLKAGYKVVFVNDDDSSYTVSSDYDGGLGIGDKGFFNWQIDNQSRIAYFKIESTASPAGTNSVSSPMGSTEDSAVAAFTPDPAETGPLDGADPNLPTGVLLIVAKNIYIDKSVQRIDAILVAENTIYTCTEGASLIPYADLDNAGKCRNSLTINGAISAQNIKFQRVGGSRYLNSIYDEQQNCHLSHGIQNCAARGGMPNNTGKTAEIINFPAYLYFTSPYLNNVTNVGASPDDNMFTAPPLQ